MTETQTTKPVWEDVPYQGKNFYGMVDDMIEPGALDLDNSDERLWIPQADGVHFRPLILSVSQGYFVNLLRVRKTGTVSRHRHSGPVHALVLRGKWHYLEHDWVAEQGTYAFETPGDIHTLTVPPDVQEMVTLFHVTGDYVYVHADGTPWSVEDVFTKLEMARNHYEAVGLGAEYADRLIR